MNIIHVLKHAVRGNGSVHVAVDLACAQADAGHRVVFASARGSYDELLRRHGVLVHDLPEPVDARSLVRHTLSLLRLAHTVRPTVLHAHMMSSALAAALVSRLTGSALVTTVHNSFDGHSWMMRAGDVVVAVSDAERRNLLGRGFPDRRVITVLNGADASPREELPRDDIGDLRRPAVMTLSGLHPRKAVDDIVAAFGKVHDEFPQWHLNVVGWGPAKAALEAQVTSLGLSDSVHFLGSTLTPRYLLEQAEVFATASLADPCPLTSTEARAAGCAMIGTTVGGVPEVLDHGRAGQLVPPRDPEAMAAALRRLMADPEELARWRAAAVVGAEHLTVARVAAEHEQVYVEAVEHRRSPRSWVDPWVGLVKGALSARGARQRA